MSSLWMIPYVTTLRVCLKKLPIMFHIPGEDQSFPSQIERSQVLFQDPSPRIAKVINCGWRHAARGWMQLETGRAATHFRGVKIDTRSTTRSQHSRKRTYKHHKSTYRSYNSQLEQLCVTGVIIQNIYSLLAMNFVIRQAEIRGNIVKSGKIDTVAGQIQVVSRGW